MFDVCVSGRKKETLARALKSLFIKIERTCLCVIMMVAAAEGWWDASRARSQNFYIYILEGEIKSMHLNARVRVCAPVLSDSQKPPIACGPRENFHPSYTRCWIFCSKLAHTTIVSNTALLWCFRLNFSLLCIIRVKSNVRFILRISSIYHMALAHFHTCYEVWGAITHQPLTTPRFSQWPSIKLRQQKHSACPILFDTQIDKI